MDYATRSLIDTLASRPAARSVASVPAPRRTSRLDGAIPVKPAAPAPSAPVTKGRSRSAAAATPVVVPPASKKVVRIPRDPAVAAAEAERKLQAKAAAEAELVSKVEAARVAAEAEAAAERLAAEQAADAERSRQAQAARAEQAEAERKAQSDREIAEDAGRKEHELQSARDAFLTVVRRAPDAFFVQTWDGKCSRGWFEKNISISGMDWISKTRIMFDDAMVDYRRKEDLAAAKAKAEFQAFVEAIDLDVIPHIRLGPDWHPRRTTRDELIELAVIGTPSEMANVRNAVAKAQVRARADAEAKVAALAKAKIDPKSRHFSMTAFLEDKRQKAAEAGGVPAIPVAPERSVKQIAATEAAVRRINGLPPIPEPKGAGSTPGVGAGRGFVPPTKPTNVRAKAGERELLNERIRALDSTVVTNVYRGNNTRWRWETIEAMLSVSASDKEANKGLAEFVSRCESVKAKRKGR